MKQKRETLLHVSVGGGLKLPVFEGDEISLATRGDRTVYIWKPLNTAGGHLDYTRVKKGKHGERHLHRKFFDELKNEGALFLLDANRYRVTVKESIHNTKPTEKHTASFNQQDRNMAPR